MHCISYKAPAAEALSGGKEGSGQKPIAKGNLILISAY
jgi:hypothetical protein